MPVARELRVICNYVYSLVQLATSPLFGTLIPTLRKLTWLTHVAHTLLPC